MEANFLILSDNTLPQAFKKHRIGRVAGSKARTLKTFFEQVAQALDFPDYFGFNLDSFDELLNDFEWIKEEKIAIYITETDQFLVDEKKDDKIADLINLMDASAEDWKWMETEDDVEDFDQKELIYLLADSPRIIGILEAEGVAFDRI